MEWSDSFYKKKTQFFFPISGIKDLAELIQKEKNHEFELLLLFVKSIFHITVVARSSLKSWQALRNNTCNLHGSPSPRILSSTQRLYSSSKTAKIAIRKVTVNISTLEVMFHFPIFNHRILEPYGAWKVWMGIGWRIAPSNIT